LGFIVFSGRKWYTGFIHDLRRFFMDFQQQPNGYQPNPNYSYNMNQAPQRNYMDKRSTGLATASIALGIVSIVTFCCLYAALPCGALAIILGLLSRGGEMTFSTTGKIGIVLGIIGLVLTIALYTFVIVMMFTNADFINQMSNGNTADYNELMRQFNEMNQMYQSENICKRKMRGNQF